MKTTHRGPGAPKKDPRLLKVPVGFKIQHWLVDELRDSPESQNYLIEHALIETYGWQPPEIKS